MMADEFNKFERVVLRNQRLMMMAIANLVRENTDVSNEFHANRLVLRVKEMEQAWDWLAPPGERL